MTETLTRVGFCGMGTMGAAMAANVAAPASPDRLEPHPGPGLAVLRRWCGRGPRSSRRGGGQRHRGHLRLGYT